MERPSAAGAAFARVLAGDSGAGPAARARAYAGVAICATRADPPDVDGAKEMLTAAIAACDGNNFSTPEDVTRATAVVTLVEEALRRGVGVKPGFGDDADSIDAEISAIKVAIEAAAAKGDGGAADARRAELALMYFFRRRDGASAVDAALDIVKRGDKSAGRELCVALFDAVGGEVAAKGRRRLGNLWFA